MPPSRQRSVAVRPAVCVPPASPRSMERGSLCVRAASLPPQAHSLIAASSRWRSMTTSPVGRM